MGDVKIRRMVTADGAAVAELSKELGYELTVAEVYERIGSLDNDSQAVVYVAILDGNVVGWIEAHDRRLLQYPRVLEIGGIVTAPEHRGEGIGTELVAAVIGWGRARGHRWLWARSNVERTNTHQFFESVGFERDKTSYTFTLPVQ